MPILSYILTALAAYLLGSIPTGFLVGKAKGIDIRAAGSGNIGATNSIRVLGKAAGIFVLVVDALKGYLAVYLGAIIYRLVFQHYEAVPDSAGFYPLPTKQGIELFALIAGIFAVLGHNYTCWLKFKGGKGIATTAGVYLALAPVALGIALAVFILTVVITRYVSVGSIAASIVLPVAVWFTQKNLFLEIVTVALCALAIYKHKSNIQRLMTGTENRLGKKSSTTEKMK